MDKIRDFLTSSIIGRVLHTDELVYKLEDGAIEGVYADQMVFANLLFSPTKIGKARYEYNGTCFDVNPADFSRNPSDSTYPKFLSKER